VYIACVLRQLPPEIEPQGLFISRRSGMNQINETAT
jgi:hypothetical protein